MNAEQKQKYLKIPPNLLGEGQPRKLTMLEVALVTFLIVAFIVLWVIDEVLSLLNCNGNTMKQAD